MSIDWLVRHRSGLGRFRLPGMYAMPVVHSHQSLCVLRIAGVFGVVFPLSAATGTGALVLVTSQIS